MYYLCNSGGWLWLCLLLWNYSSCHTTCVPGFSLHHCFGKPPKCLVEKAKAIAVTLSHSESLWCLPLVLHVLVTVSTTVTNSMTKGTLGRKGFVSILVSGYTSLLKEAVKGTWRRNWSKAERSAAYWLALHCLLRLISYTTRIFCLRGTTHNERPLPLSVINLEKCPAVLPTGSLMEAHSQLSLLFKLTNPSGTLHLYYIPHKNSEIGTILHEWIWRSPRNVVYRDCSILKGY